MRYAKEILSIEEAFVLLVLHHKDDQLAEQMVTKVFHAKRNDVISNDGNCEYIDLMFDCINKNGECIVRSVTEAEIEVFGLDASPWYVSLL